MKPIPLQICTASGILDINQSFSQIFSNKFSDKPENARADSLLLSKSIGTLLLTCVTDEDARSNLSNVVDNKRPPACDHSWAPKFVQEIMSCLDIYPLVNRNTRKGELFLGVAYGINLYIETEKDWYDVCLPENSFLLTSVIYSDNPYPIDENFKS
jgi:hypothetical protein